MIRLLQEVKKNYSELRRNEQLIALFMIANSFVIMLSLLVNYAIIAQKTLLLFSLFSLLILLSGIKALTGSGLAFRIIGLISLLQIVQIHSKDFFLDFASLGLVLNFGFNIGMQSYQINLLALVVAIFAWKGSKRLRKPFYFR